MRSLRQTFVAADFTDLDPGAGEAFGKIWTGSLPNAAIVVGGTYNVTVPFNIDHGLYVTDSIAPGPEVTILIGADPSQVGLTAAPAPSSTILDGPGTNPVARLFGGASGLPTVGSVEITIYYLDPALDLLLPAGPLLSVAELRSLIQTDLTDPALALLEAIAESEIIGRYGPNYPGPVTYTKTRTDPSVMNPNWVYLDRPIESVISITEYIGDEVNETVQVLGATDYRIHYSGYGVERIGTGVMKSWLFGHRVVIVYTPKDDSMKRRGVIAELVRMSTRSTGLKTETTGNISSSGFDSYSQARQDLIDSLGSGLGFS